MGRCPEWQRGRTVNSLAVAFTGSSPVRPTLNQFKIENVKLKIEETQDFNFTFSILNFKFNTAHVAQLVEHTLGKGEVTRSILVAGFSIVVMGWLSAFDH